jgi:hypothetical protein
MSLVAPVRMLLAADAGTNNNRDGTWAADGQGFFALNSVQVRPARGVRCGCGAAALAAGAQCAAAAARHQTRPVTRPRVCLDGLRAEPVSARRWRRWPALAR